MYNLKVFEEIKLHVKKSIAIAYKPEMHTWKS